MIEISVAAISILFTFFLWYIVIGTDKNEPRRKEQSNNFKKLVGACFGDRAKAERLIKYEMQNMGSMPRDKAAKLALERLEQDRKAS